jgi:hypothetical protein
MELYNDFLVDKEYEDDDDDEAFGYTLEASKALAYI